MTVVVVSVHCDDAILSVGSWLSHHPGALIVTMFAGDPLRSRELSGWDRKCGFVTSREAMRTRRVEDRRAASMLGAHVRHVPLMDGAYRDTVPYADGVLEAALVGALHGVTVDLAVTPLGIGHSDHVATGQACRNVFAGAAHSVIVYEDLPYRVEMPEEAVRTLDGLDVDWYHDAPPDARVAAESKRRAASRYASQIWAVPAWALEVPERTWRIRQPELALEEADDDA